MKQIRTVKLQLKVDKQMFKPTFEAYTKAFNYVCKTAWDNQEFNGVRLHHLTYKQVRKLTKLKSQLTISARVKATEALAAVQARKKKGKKVSCPQSKCSAIRYDDRSLTIDFTNRNINILTLEGRVRLPIFVSKYFKQYLTWKRCSADLFQVKGKTFLHIVFEKETEDVSPSGTMVGIDRVVYVDARYTSQRCSKCGHIHKDNRQKQSKFKCRNCGFQLNADLNASKNIVLKYLDATGYPDRATVNLPSYSLTTANVP